MESWCELVAADPETMQDVETRHIEQIGATAQRIRHSQVVWKQDSLGLKHDWSAEQSLLEALHTVDAVIFRGISMRGIESLFRLRALQVDNHEGFLNLPSVVFVSPSGDADAIIPGLYRRIVASWPFRSVLFVAEGVASQQFEAENIPVIDSMDARRLELGELLAHPRAIVSHARPDQSIGVQIQPMWGRCGSSTAFANEIDCLLDRQLFTIRIFIDPDRQYGETLERQFSKLLPQNTLDSGACLETVACSSVQSKDVAANEYDSFWLSVQKRTHAVIHDDFVARLVRRADVAIVNHAVNMGFAASNCPDAALVLDTHDYLTRGALERARSGGDEKAFPNCSILRRHTALENRLWQTADACATVSYSEETRIRRHASECLVIFPEPYAKPWVDLGREAKWDLLLVADHHYFNVKSVSWFLENVVEPDDRLRGMRIGIVGKVRQQLEPEWSTRLPNVEWLGFVQDLDEIRNQSRIAVCPDRAGTGVSVKTLTALAAGQPIVATSVALRGMPSLVCDMVPCSDTTAGMADDIVGLLDNPSNVAARQAISLDAHKALHNIGSYATAVELAKSRPAASMARQKLLAEFGKIADPRAARASKPDSVQIAEFKAGGNATPYLGTGWHEAESWGRWMDGKRASLSLPLSWFNEPAMVEIGFLDGNRSTGVSIACQGRVLTSPALTMRDRFARFRIDKSMRDASDDTVTLAFLVDSTFCPHDHDGSPDERVLGAGIKTITVTAQNTELDSGTVHLAFKAGGNATPYLGTGWHEAESWGRWMDGKQASLVLPLSWFNEPAVVEIGFLDIKRSVRIGVACHGRVLTPSDLTMRDRFARFLVDKTMRDASGDTITLDFLADSTFCQHDHDGSPDERVLGAGIKTVTVTAQNLDFSRGAARLEFKAGGNATPYLGTGWHAAESWGRWMDGKRASLALPLSWFNEPAMVEIGFLDSNRSTGVSIACQGRVLTSPDLTMRDRFARFRIDKSMRGASGDTVTLDFLVDSTFCQHDHDGSPDERVLGAGIKTVIVAVQNAEFSGGSAQLAFKAGGNATPYLGMGWHEGEKWGRWMDGKRASLSLPLSWFNEPAMVEIGFLDIKRSTGVRVACQGKALTPPDFSTRQRVGRFRVDKTMRDASGDTITLDFLADSTFCQHDHDGSPDERVLGAGIKAVSITAQNVDFSRGTARLEFKTGGNATSYLGMGWHEAESWGRWMDGKRASLALPLSWFSEPAMVKIRFMNGHRSTGVSIACQGRVLTPPDLSTRQRIARFRIDKSMRDASGDTITLDFLADSTFCPQESDYRDADDRVLGAGIELVTITQQALTRVKTMVRQMMGAGHLAATDGSGTA